MFCLMIKTLVGMSDLCSPMIILLNDEADAFWCFERLMRRLVNSNVNFYKTKSFPYSYCLIKLNESNLNLKLTSMYVISIYLIVYNYTVKE